MTQFVHSITGSWLRLGLSTRQASALAVIAFGILLAGSAGFAGSHALHEGTHDTRHAFGLPCH
jgi:cobalt transporter subunit CbtB